MLMGTCFSSLRGVVSTWCHRCSISSWTSDVLPSLSPPAGRPAAGWSTSILPCSWLSGAHGCAGDVVFSVDVMVTVTVFGMWAGGMLLRTGSFSASSVMEGWLAPDMEEVWREEVETGEDADEEGEEEAEQ